MAAKKIEDFRSCDWDDSALIRAYNKGTKIREKHLQDAKNSKMGNSSKENKKDEKWWRSGDYCRVKYLEDDQIYEAMIHSINDGVATVRFIGYGDRQLVSLRDLKESGGKRARRRQLEDARAGYSTGSESCNTTITDRDSVDHRRNKHYENASLTDKNAANPTVAENSYVMPPNPSQFASNHSHGATCYEPALVPHSVPPTSMPFLPGPPVPPMPQCPSVTQNPSLSAMLVSWYMAGYYTGLNQVQSGQNGCQQHCCNRSNRCCH